MKKIFTVLVFLLLLLSGCSKQEEKVIEPINIGVLKGPTSMGAALLMQEAENDTNSLYKFDMSTEGSAIVGKLSNGDLDLACLPTNVAASLYNKTSGKFSILAINCTSVLYIIENGNSISDVADLKGKTIYCNGQGANPEYVLRYILEENGIDSNNDVELIFKDSTEILQLMVTNQAEVCMLPVPVVTTALMKNTDLRIALNLGDEYKKVTSNGSELTMGALVVNNDYLKENTELVKQFLVDYEESINNLFTNIDEASEAIAHFEITGSSQIAKNAIPNAGITFIKGSEVKTVLEGYLQVLYDKNPSSIGGAMPQEDFYIGDIFD